MRSNKRSKERRIKVISGIGNNVGSVAVTPSTVTNRNHVAGCGVSLAAPQVTSLWSGGPVQGCGW